MYIYRKTISLITLSFFVFNTLAYGAGPVSIVPSNPTGPAYLPVHSEYIQVPSEFGEVKERYQAPLSTTSIIHIQTAHGSLEAQKNIHALLKHLKETYDIDLLLLEGAATKLRPEIFRFFEDDSLNRKIADTLLKEAMLTGAESYLLEAHPEVEAYGIEDVKTYREDLELFRSVLKAKPQSEAFIEQTKKALRLKEDKIFSKELKKLVSEWRIYKSDRISLIRYIRMLEKLAKRDLDIDLNNGRFQKRFPSLIRIVKLNKLEGKIDHEKALKEKQEIETFLSGKIDGETLEAFRVLEKQQHPRFPLEKIYDELGEKIDFTQYPSFHLYSRHLMFQSELNSQELFHEIEDLTDQLFTQLPKTKAEKDLLQQIKETNLLEKLLSLELTRKQWSQIKSMNSGKWIFDTPSGVSKMRVPTTQVKNALNFYKLAEQRETHFLNKSQALMKQNKKRKAILISGGFHTQGLKEQLKQKGISYTEIAPKISSVEDAKEKYLKAITGSPNLLNQSQIEAVLHMLSLQDQMELDPTREETTIPNIVAAIQKALNEEGKTLTLDEIREIVETTLVPGSLSSAEVPGTFKASSLGRAIPAEGVWGGADNRGVVRTAYPEEIAGAIQDFFAFLADRNERAPEDGPVTVVDVGTGPYAALETGVSFLQRRGVLDQFSLIGTDLFESKGTKPPTVSFKKTSAEALTDVFDPGSVDAAMGTFSLLYTDLGRSLPQINKILKDSGEAFFVLHHKNSVYLEGDRDQQEQVDIQTAINLFGALRAFIDNPNIQTLIKILRLRKILTEMRFSRGNSYRNDLSPSTTGTLRIREDIFLIDLTIYLMFKEQTLEKKGGVPRQEHVDFFLQELMANTPINVTSVNSSIEQYFKDLIRSYIKEYQNIEANSYPLSALEHLELVEKNYGFLKERMELLQFKAGVYGAEDEGHLRQLFRNAGFQVLSLEPLRHKDIDEAFPPPEEELKLYGWKVRLKKITEPIEVLDVALRTPGYEAPPLEGESLPRQILRRSRAFEYAEKFLEAHSEERGEAVRIVISRINNLLNLNEIMATHLASKTVFSPGELREVKRFLEALLETPAEDIAEKRTQLGALKTQVTAASLGAEVSIPFLDEITQTEERYKQVLRRVRDSGKVAGKDMRELKTHYKQIQKRVKFFLRVLSDKKETATYKALEAYASQFSGTHASVLDWLTVYRDATWPEVYSARKKQWVKQSPISYFFNHRKAENVWNRWKGDEALSELLQLKGEQDSITEAMDPIESEEKKERYHKEFRYQLKRSMAGQVNRFPSLTHKLAEEIFVRSPQDKTQKETLLTSVVQQAFPPDAVSPVLQEASVQQSVSQIFESGFSSIYGDVGDVIPDLMRSETGRKFVYQQIASEADFLRKQSVQATVLKALTFTLILLASFYAAVLSLPTALDFFSEDPDRTELREDFPEPIRRETPIDEASDGEIFLPEELDPETEAFLETLTNFESIEIPEPEEMGPPEPEASELIVQNEEEIRVIEEELRTFEENNVEFLEQNRVEQEAVEQEVERIQTEIESVDEEIEAQEEVEEVIQESTEELVTTAETFEEIDQQGVDEEVPEEWNEVVVEAEVIQPEDTEAGDAVPEEQDLPSPVEEEITIPEDRVQEFFRGVGNALADVLGIEGRQPTSIDVNSLLGSNLSSSEISQGGGNHSPGAWIASVEGGNNYLSSGAYHEVNVVTGELTPAQPEVVRWRSSGFSTDWETVRASGRIVIPPDYVIAEIQTENRVSEVEVLYDRANRVWYIQTDNDGGMLRVGIRPQEPGELGPIRSMTITGGELEEIMPDFIRQTIEEARSLSLEERIRVKMRILSLFYYSTNPILGEQAESDENILRSIFTHFACKCDGFSLLNAVISSELDIPIEIHHGFMDVDFDGQFYVGNAHAWNVTEQGLEEATALADGVSPLYGRSDVTREAWEDEYEMLVERADQIRSSFEQEQNRNQLEQQLSELEVQRELLINMTNQINMERARLQNTLELLAEERAELENRLQQEQLHTEASDSVTRELSREEIYQLYQNLTQSYEVRLEQLRNISIDEVVGERIMVDFEYRLTVHGLSDVFDNEYELMAGGHYLFGVLHELERNLPEYELDFRTWKNRLFSSIQQIAEEKGWELFEPLRDPGNTVAFTGSQGRNVLNDLVIQAGYAEDSLTGERIELNEGEEVYDYSQGIFVIRMTDENFRLAGSLTQEYEGRIFQDISLSSSLYENGTWFGSYIEDLGYTGESSRGIRTHQYRAGFLGSAVSHLELPEEITLNFRVGVPVDSILKHPLFLPNGTFIYFARSIISETGNKWEMLGSGADIFNSQSEITVFDSVESPFLLPNGDWGFKAGVFLNNNFSSIHKGFFIVREDGSLLTTDISIRNDSIDHPTILPDGNWFINSYIGDYRDRRGHLFGSFEGSEEIASTLFTFRSVDRFFTMPGGGWLTPLLQENENYILIGETERFDHLLGREFSEIQLHDSSRYDLPDGGHVFKAQLPNGNWVFVGDSTEYEHLLEREFTSLSAPILLPNNQWMFSAQLENGNHVLLGDFEGQELLEGQEFLAFGYFATDYNPDLEFFDGSINGRVIVTFEPSEKWASYARYPNGQIGMIGPWAEQNNFQDRRFEQLSVDYISLDRRHKAFAGVERVSNDSQLISFFSSEPEFHTIPPIPINIPNITNIDFSYSSEQVWILAVYDEQGERHVFGPLADYFTERVSTESSNFIEVHGVDANNWLGVIHDVAPGNIEIVGSSAVGPYAEEAGIQPQDSFNHIRNFRFLDNGEWVATARRQGADVSIGTGAESVEEEVGENWDRRRSFNLPDGQYITLYRNILTGETMFSPYIDISILGPLQGTHPPGGASRVVSDFNSPNGEEVIKIGAWDFLLRWHSYFQRLAVLYGVTSPEAGEVIREDRLDLRWERVSRLAGADSEAARIELAELMAYMTTEPTVRFFDFDRMVEIINENRHGLMRDIILYNELSNDELMWWNEFLMNSPAELFAVEIMLWSGDRDFSSEIAREVSDDFDQLLRDYHDDWLRQRGVEELFLSAHLFRNSDRETVNQLNGLIERYAERTEESQAEFDALTQELDVNLEALNRLRLRSTETSLSDDETRMYLQYVHEVYLERTGQAAPIFDLELSSVADDYNSVQLARALRDDTELARTRSFSVGDEEQRQYRNELWHEMNDELNEIFRPSDISFILSEVPTIAILNHFTGVNRYQSNQYVLKRHISMLLILLTENSTQNQDLLPLLSRMQVVESEDHVHLELEDWNRVSEEISAELDDITMRLVNAISRILMQQRELLDELAIMRRQLEEQRAMQEENRRWLLSQGEDYPEQIERSRLETELERVRDDLERQTGIRGIPFDVEISQASRESAWFGAVELLRQNWNEFKIRGLSLEERAVREHHNERWTEINDRLNELVEDQYQGDPNIKATSILWHEMKQDGLVWAFFFALLYLLFTPVNILLLIKDKTVGKSAQQVVQEIWNKNPWFDGKKFNARAALDKPNNEIEISTIRSSLSSQERAMFDLAASVAKEVPTQSFPSRIRRLLSLIPFIGWFLVSYSKSWAHRQKMNAAVLRIAQNMNDKTAPEQVYAELKNVLKTYEDPKGKKREVSEVPVGDVVSAINREMGRRTPVQIKETRTQFRRPDGSPAQLRKGQGTDLHRLRKAQTGDRVKDIDWKASARRENLIIQERTFEQEVKTSLLVDMRELTDAGNHEQWVGQLMNSLKAQYQKLRRGTQSSDYKVENILFVLPNGKLKLIQPPLSPNLSFERLVKKLIPILSYEMKAVNEQVESSDSFSLSRNFYTPEENKRYEQQVAGILDGANIQLEDLQRAGNNRVSQLRGQDVFIVGNPTKLDPLIQHLQSLGAKPLHWEANQALPITAASLGSFDEDLEIVKKFLLENGIDEGVMKARRRAGTIELNLRKTGVTDISDLKGLGSLSQLLLYELDIEDKSVYEVFEAHPNVVDFFVYFPSGSGLSGRSYLEKEKGIQVPFPPEPNQHLFDKVKVRGFPVQRLNEAGIRDAKARLQKVKSLIQVDYVEKGLEILLEYPGQFPQSMVYRKEVAALVSPYLFDLTLDEELREELIKLFINLLPSLATVERSGLVPIILNTTSGEQAAKALTERVASLEELSFQVSDYEARVNARESGDASRLARMILGPEAYFDRLQKPRLADKINLFAIAFNVLLIFGGLYLLTTPLGETVFENIVFRFFSLIPFGIVLWGLVETYNDRKNPPVRDDQLYLDLETQILFEELDVDDQQIIKEGRNIVWQSEGFVFLNPEKSSQLMNYFLILKKEDSRLYLLGETGNAMFEYSDTESYPDLIAFHNFLGLLADKSPKVFDEAGNETPSSFKELALMFQEHLIKKFPEIDFSVVTDISEAPQPEEDVLKPIQQREKTEGASLGSVQFESIIRLATQHENVLFLRERNSELMEWFMAQLFDDKGMLISEKLTVQQIMLLGVFGLMLMRGDEMDAVSVKRKVFDVRGLPDNPKDLASLLLFVTHQQDLEYQLLLQGTVDEVKQFREKMVKAGLDIPENFKLEMMAGKLSKYLSGDTKTPMGLVTEDPLMVEGLYQPNLIRVMGTSDIMMQNATGVALAERLLKAIEPSDPFQIQLGENLISAKDWINLLEVFRDQAEMILSAA